MIYHITTQAAWEAACKAGAYSADSLSHEGFIHCSTRQQVLPTAGRFFHGQRGLLLLEINPQKASHEVRYENLEGGEERFPHLYGPLELAAVVRLLQFEPDAEGNFSFPTRVHGAAASDEFAAGHNQV